MKFAIRLRTKPARVQIVFPSGASSKRGMERIARLFWSDGFDQQFDHHHDPGRIRSILRECGYGPRKQPKR